jgi:hypothetical protein
MKKSSRIHMNLITKIIYRKIHVDEWVQAAYRSAPAITLVSSSSPVRYVLTGRHSAAQAWGNAMRMSLGGRSVPLQWATCRKNTVTGHFAKYHRLRYRCHSTILPSVRVVIYMDLHAAGSVCQFVLEHKTDLSVTIYMNYFSRKMTIFGMLRRVVW